MPARYLPAIALLLLARAWLSSLDVIASTTQYGIHAVTGANTLLSKPNSAMEPALVPVLEAEAKLLIERTLPRAKTARCRDKITETASYIRERFDRNFARHPFSELHCPIATLAPTKSFSQSESMLPGAKPPQPLLDRIGAPRCRAAIAFVFQLHHGTEVAQLSRLLQKILRLHHLYHFSLDSTRNPPRTDPDTWEQAIGVDLLKKQIRAIVSRHGPVRHLESSRTNVDVLYTGHGLHHSHILATRDLLRSDVPPWNWMSIRGNINCCAIWKSGNIK